MTMSRYGANFWQIVIWIGQANRLYTSTLS